MVAPRVAMDLTYDRRPCRCCPACRWSPCVGCETTGICDDLTCRCDPEELYGDELDGDELEPDDWNDI